MHGYTGDYSGILIGFKFNSDFGGARNSNRKSY